MIYPFSEQIIMIINFLILGIFLSICLDTITILFSKNKIVHYLFQIISWIIVSIIGLRYVCKISEGYIPFYIILFFFIGYLMYVKICKKRYVKTLYYILKNRKEIKLALFPVQLYNIIKSKLVVKRKKKMKRIIILIQLILIVLFSGCVKKEENVDIYASIYPVYFLTTSIVQDKQVVKQIYPTGADVHDYDPSNGKQLIKMSKAKMMFYIGAGLEGFIESSSKVFSKTDIKLVELSNYVDLYKQTSDGCVKIDNEEKHNGVSVADTHLWLDPLRMITFARTICNEVCKIDPDNKDFYRDNTDVLVQKLREIDDLYVNALNNPLYNKIILVDHDSYLYWEQRYGIKRIRTRIDNESCETNISTLKASIEVAKENNIKYIITTYKENVCKIIEKYQYELDAEILELNHLSTLYKENIDNGEDYLTIMKTNLETLLVALPKNN